MVRIAFIDGTGEHVADATEGRSLMQAARDNGYSFLAGDCGGTCTCGTCHAYIDAAWLYLLTPVSMNEANLLDALDDTRYNSRLTCRVIASPALEGIVIRVPQNR